MKKKKPQARSSFYRVAAWLHLWLGLISGAIMVVVCVTGCIWVFQDEITLLTHPEMKVTAQDKPVITPAALLNIAGAVCPGKRPVYAIYQQNRAITMGLGVDSLGMAMLRVHPYTGQVLSLERRKAGETDFFRFILNGHRTLWLPKAIGRPIVDYGTLLFVLILLSGIVLWWPRKWTKAARQQGFSIKWKASLKRVNYDLHKVLGFYALLVLLVSGLTGLVFGVAWFSKGLYWVTSGGNSLPANIINRSDTSLPRATRYTLSQAIDHSWNKVLTQFPAAQGFYVVFADTARASSVIAISIYPSAGKYYDRCTVNFDQHTGKQLPFPNKLFETSYAASSGAAKLRRMNYDIHVGSMLGLPGKILLFFTTLIGASLPITGFMIWWGKHKKKGVAPARKVEAKLSTSASRLPS
ncbi:PepSY domain-containing protein [Chitinophaga costaii]|nr:PepSY-associated TM helix domain-containing protein [Chitinophaga costaii]PUZ21556.1 PepSY domain-containing protein [Chitinophaga costaii]